MSVNYHHNSFIYFLSMVFFISMFSCIVQHLLHNTRKLWKKWEDCIPAKIYLFEVNNRSSRKNKEICSELTIKTPERRQWRGFDDFVNFERISHLFLVFRFLGSMFMFHIILPLLQRHILKSFTLTKYFFVVKILFRS